jgi:hypothetical protein
MHHAYSYDDEPLYKVAFRFQLGSAITFDSRLGPFQVFETSIRQSVSAIYLFSPNYSADVKVVRMHPSPDSNLFLCHFLSGDQMESLAFVVESKVEPLFATAAT